MIRIWLTNSKKTITNQYKIEAERGNSEFFLSYGEVFYLGLFGCEEDIDKALYWFKKAAQNNNSEAQYNIGMIYLNGEGVKRNHNVAKKWFEKSSLQNHYESNYQLACMYLDEELGMLDQKLGYEFLKKHHPKI